MKEHKENLIKEMDTALQRVLSNHFSNENFRQRLETIYNTKDIDSLSEEEKIKALLKYSQPYEREEELERKSKEIAKTMKSFEEMDFPELDLPETDFDFEFLGDEDNEEE